MEIIYGVVLLVTFILGLGIGLTIPFFVKKYVKDYKESKEDKEDNNSIEEKDNNIPFVPKDLLREWVTGEEVKPNDKQ